MRLSDGAIVANFTAPVSLPRGGGAIAWQCLDNSPFVGGGPCNATSAVLANVGCAANGTDCVLVASVVDSAAAAGAAAVLSANTQLLAAPGSIAHSMSFIGNLTVTAGSPGPGGAIPVYVSFPAGTPPSAVALLVTLTTIIPGRFTDNFFTLLQPSAASAAVAMCADSAAAICPARVASDGSGGAAATLYFTPWTDATEGGVRLLQSARVQHLGQYAQ